MTPETRDRSSLNSFLKEHQELARRVAELRKWWTELDELGIRKFGEMEFRVQELRDLLAAHFAEEERGGYLGSALAVAPQFASQAATLCAQHSQFLERLDHLIARLRDSDATSNYWRASRSETEQVIADLRQHGQRENTIVQAAFEQDLGTND